MFMPCETIQIPKRKKGNRRCGRSPAAIADKLDRGSRPSRGLSKSFGDVEIHHGSGMGFACRVEAVNRQRSMGKNLPETGTDHAHTCSLNQSVTHVLVVAVQMQRTCLVRFQFLPTPLQPKMLAEAGSVEHVRLLRRQMQHTALQQ